MMNVQDQPTNPDSISRRHLVMGGSIGLIAFGANAQAAAEKTRAECPNAGALEDQLAIKRLIYRYAVALDQLDAGSLAACFAPDAMVQGGGLNLRGDIGGELIKRARAAQSRLTQFTLHLVINHWYEVQGRTATGVATCVDSSVAGPKDQWIKTDLHVRFDDDLIKQPDGRWQFLKRVFQPLFVTEGPVIDNATFMARGRRQQ